MPHSDFRMVTAWSTLPSKIFVPHTEAQCRHLVAVLDDLIEEVGGDESHPLASLMDIVGVLIERYEDGHVPELS
ncbi:MAG: hypothetical protein J4G05_02825 [Chlorobi bacterium]|nr:hypothetical protein [Chlorobiota bacterium]